MFCWEISRITCSLLLAHFPSCILPCKQTTRLCIIQHFMPQIPTVSWEQQLRNNFLDAFWPPSPFLTFSLSFFNFIWLYSVTHPSTPPPPPPALNSPLQVLRKIVEEMSVQTPPPLTLPSKRYVKLLKICLFRIGIKQYFFLEIYKINLGRTCFYGVGQKAETSNFFRLSTDCAQCWASTVLAFNHPLGVQIVCLGFLWIVINVDKKCFFKSEN